MAHPAPIQPPEVQTAMSRVICGLCYGTMHEHMPGAWRCDQGHELLTSDDDAGQAPESGGPARRPSIEAPVGANPLMDRALGMAASVPYYRTLQRQMGIFGQIGWVPQASQAGDGRLLSGPAKKGGGSKSGRKRKKPKKKPRPEWEV